MPRKTAPVSLRVIVGLGNPGSRYAHTFHNAGVLALDALRRASAPEAKKRRRPLFDYWKTDGTVFVRPNAYMNVSGPAVADALAFFKATPAQLMLIHDDSDLPLGTVRHATKSGAAGHRGVASVIAALKTQAFERLRLGIRIRPGKAGEFVLRPMSAADADRLVQAAQDAMAKLTVNVTPSGTF
jgi:PTH1 family peptidyl-tRNA hydrolase